MTTTTIDTITDQADAREACADAIQSKGGMSIRITTVTPEGEASVGEVMAANEPTILEY